MSARRRGGKDSIVQGRVHKIQFLARLIKSLICNERTCFNSFRTRLYGELWIVWVVKMAAEFAQYDKRDV